MSLSAEFYTQLKRSLLPVVRVPLLTAGIAISLTLASGPIVKDAAFEAAMQTVQQEAIMQSAPFLVNLGAQPGWISRFSGGSDTAHTVESFLKGSKTITFLVPFTEVCPMVLGETDRDSLQSMVPRLTLEQAARLIAYHEASHCQQREAGLDLDSVQQKEIYADVRATLFLLREDPTLKTVLLEEFAAFRAAGDAEHQTGDALNALKVFLEGRDPATLSNPDIDKLAASLAQGEDIRLVSVSPPQTTALNAVNTLRPDREVTRGNPGR